MSCPAAEIRQEEGSQPDHEVGAAIHTHLQWRPRQLLAAASDGSNGFSSTCLSCAAELVLRKD